MLDLTRRSHRGWRAGPLLVGAALCAMPRFAAPDSHLVTGPRDQALRASAHLDFKIIIPSVLGLDLEPGRARAGALGVALFGNTRGLTLGSSIEGAPTPRHGLILTAVARGVISEHAFCALDAPLGPRRVLCTAAMP